MSEEETRMMPARLDFDPSRGVTGGDQDLQTPLVGVGFVGDTHFGDTHFGSSPGDGANGDSSPGDGANGDGAGDQRAQRSEGRVSAKPSNASETDQEVRVLTLATKPQKEAKLRSFLARSSAFEIYRKLLDAGTQLPLGPGWLLLGGLFGGGVGVLAAGYPINRAEVPALRPAGSQSPEPDQDETDQGSQSDLLLAEGLVEPPSSNVASAEVAPVEERLAKAALRPSAIAQTRGIHGSSAAESLPSPREALGQVLSGECALAEKTYARLADAAHDDAATAKKWRAFSESVERSCAQLIPILANTAAKDGP